MEFQIIDWVSYHNNDYDNSDSESDDDGEDDDYYIINLFGRTLDGKSVYVKVNNFTPYFYIGIPENWDDNTINTVLRNINNKKIFYGLQKKYFLSCDVVKKYKLYGFNGEKKLKFIRLVFSNHIAMKKASWQFKNGIKIFSISRQPIKFKIYESNIDPLLRCCHHRKLQTCGWVNIKDYSKIKNKNSDISIQTDWTNLKFIDKKEMAPFRIMSFDIECTSCDGNFPQAERPGDKIIQIGSTFNKIGNKKCYYKSMITLGTCDPIEGVDVQSFDNEKDVILAWGEMIEEQDPDLVGGYYNWVFDEPYIEGRARLLGILEILLKLLSKVYNRKVKFIIKDLSSAALGDNKLKYFDMHGRVSIDLMKIIQREYKLDSNKLDYVAEYFINGEVLDIKLRNKSKKTELKILYSDEVNVGNYIKLYYPINKFDNYYYKEGLKLKIIEIKDDIIIIEHLMSLEDLDKKWTWGSVKNDISVNDIFRLQKGSSSDRAYLAKYCIEDSELCNKILEKIRNIINSIEMANIVYVPVKFIFTRGQSIKSQSLVAKICREKNFVIPVLPKVVDDSGYEGATVFKPEIGFYNVPVSVLDFESLYPNSMINKNLSHEMYVDEIGGKYDNLPEYKYINVIYKNKNNEDIVCRYAQKGDTLGIMPIIVKDLLSHRKAVKKLMKLEKDPFKNSILDGRQLALKCTANSLYGQLGSSFSSIYKKEIAASTTATGRYMLELARDYTENEFPNIIDNVFNNLNNKKELDNTFKKYLKEEMRTDENINKITSVVKEIKTTYNINPKVIYGDSVLGDTPLLCLYNNKKIIITIEELGSNWIKYEEFKKHDTNRTDKEQCFTDMMVWGNNGWTKIKRVIRHKTIKDIYRVNTNNGVVDVTEDHSLLNEKMKIIKPNKCLINNTKLLHNYPKNNYNKFNIDNILHIIYNYKYIDDKYNKYFALGYCDSLKYTKYYLENTDGLYKYIINILTYNINKYDILNLTIYQRFYYIIGFSILKIKYEFNKKYIFYIFKNKVEASKLYYVLKSLNFNVIIQLNNNDYCLKCYFNDNHYSTIVNNIQLIKNGYNDYVYDLETDEGCFNAGIGEIIVKNTDSVFINFNITNKITNDKLLDKIVLKYAIDLGIIEGMLIKIILEYPHNLEYEKTFWPFCIFSKKRYIGNKYEFDINKYKQDYNGIVLKRRDNAPIVKEIIGGVADILLSKMDIMKTINFLNNSIDKMLNGEYPLKYFITSKTLKGKYAFRTRIAHAVLADRMSDRDPGSAPEINERVQYISVIVNEEEIFTRKIKDNNIRIKKSLEYYDKIDLDNILEIYEKNKAIIDKNELKEAEKEYIYEFNHIAKLINNTKDKLKIEKLEKIKVLPDNIYDKIRKDFIKYLDKEPKDKDIKNKIKELIIKHGNASPNIIQGDRIEDPTYIKTNNIPIDYIFYLTNQILKPAAQFYSFNIEKLEGYSDDMLNELDKDNFEKRCEIAGKLLFDKFLIKDKENKLKERDIGKKLKKSNTSNIFKFEIEEIDNVKNYEKNKIKDEKQRIKDIEKEKKRIEREKIKAEKAKLKPKRKKKVKMEDKDGNLFKNIGEIPDP